MEKYSEIVYKVPGRNAGPDGKTYDWAAVRSKEDLEGKINEGWFNTLSEAVSGSKAPVKIVAKLANKEKIKIKVKSEDRLDLEKQAKELSLKFHPATGDKKLKKLIDDKLTEPTRAREDNGEYKADDKSTLGTNEAYVGGKAPEKDNK